MQHIGLEIIDEKTSLIERSNINFAPIMQILFKVNSFKDSYSFLSTIDPYGDTYFNVHQVPRVIDELEKFKQNENALSVLKEINDTIEFLKKIEQHTFAKFIGD